jgi:hypothetical protein
MKTLGKPLQGIFVAGQRLAIHKDIVAGVFPLNDNVQAGCHRFEFSGDRAGVAEKLGRGYPIDYVPNCSQVTQVEPQLRELTQMSYGKLL